MATPSKKEPPYRMTISRMTVDKLGVKLYDRVSAVMSELIANSYDADATLVKIEGPMGELLANLDGKKVVDRGFTIAVVDNGVGMTPEQVNKFYLKVGKERRTDPERGAETRVLHRKVMGRKGIGKLAPFGICSEIEVISSGGDVVDGLDPEGKTGKGYKTAHLVLKRDGILKETDEEYLPEPGTLDGRVKLQSGTTIILRGFAHRFVPKTDDLERQLAQRFGITATNWKIELFDNRTKDAPPKKERTVGEFEIDLMPGTKLKFEKYTINTGGKDIAAYRTVDADGTVVPEVRAGVEYEGKWHPITGWMAYAKDPYKDDLMAGVRIYCHGKIAAKTAIFNRKAGFTGEFDIRSYLVGEIHADWLDDEEDLIQTDRRDIMWSHDLGAALEAWGQNAVLHLGKLSRQPLKKKMWERFQEKSNIVEKIKKAFPSPDLAPIRDRANSLAKLFGQSMREDEIENPETVASVATLVLNLAPHVALTEQLREAAEDAGSAMAALTGFLKIARIAELSSLGQVAEQRVKIIARLEALKDAAGTTEAELQELIEGAPWLINAEWSPITANETFTTLKTEYAKLYKERTGTEIDLSDFPDAKKRADFVMLSFENLAQLVEIKKPGHKLSNDEMDRIIVYVDLMKEFLADAGNKQFAKLYPNFHVTVVCDGLALTKAQKAAWEGYVSGKQLTYYNWASFLGKTRQTHQDFLKEAARQKKYAAS